MRITKKFLALTLSIAIILLSTITGNSSVNATTNKVNVMNTLANTNIAIRFAIVYQKLLN